MPKRTPSADGADAASASTAREFKSERLRIASAWLLLTGLALSVYAPALTGQFLWDDDAHVTRPELRTIAGLERIWLEPGATQQYYPLVHTTFWIEHRLWGDAPLGYHIVGVLLHATAGLLLWLILRRLQVPGAEIAAAIFVVHPIQVESVAWISELKNTLSLTLGLAALLAYLQFDGQRKPARYAVASGFFVAGLLTKTVVATLPGVLLVILWWQRGTLSWRRDVVPLVPWLAAGAAAGMVTAGIERSMLGADGVEFDWTLADRAALAGRVAWFYLGKIVWPSNLLFVYPRWTLSTAWPWPLFALAAVAALAVCWSVRRSIRGPLALALLYLGTLFPALGFVNVYPFVFSFVADHFAYVPAIAVIVGASALLARGAAGRPRVRGAMACAAIVTLAVLSYRQCFAYADPGTLYRTTLEGNPGCYLCLNNLGMLAVGRGDAEEATQRFEAALRAEPGSAEAHNNLAGLLASRGDLAGAIDHYQRSLAIAPRNVIARTNLGIALTRMGRLQDARAEFEEALRIMPGYGPAAQNLEVLRRFGVGP